MKITVFVLSVLVVAAMTVVDDAQGVGPVGTDRGHPSQRGLRPTFKWWQDSEVRSELSLSGEQVERLQDVFDSAMKNARELLPSLRAAEQEYDGFLSSGKTDDGLAFVMIEKIERLRYELSKGRAVMLYRLHKCLTPAQRLAFARRFGISEHQDPASPRRR